jgi:hypothetical protein
MDTKKLFEKNFNRLLLLNPRLQETSELLLSEAETLLEGFSVQQDIDEWSADPKRFFQYKQFSARSEEAATHLRDQYSELLEVKTFKEYYDVPSMDPHYASFLLDHRRSLQDLAIDPNANACEIFADDRHLIAFGTGDGDFLGQLLKFANYRKVTIIVNRWSELVSSFYKLDWEWVLEKVNSISPDALNIMRIDHIEECWNKLLEETPLALDGSVVYIPYNASPALKEIRDEFSGFKTNNIIDYQGFALDELNMIYNTVETLARAPHIWRTPDKQNYPAYSHCNILVCASGPSLDQSIDVVKDLSNTSLVIASGSSYETLLRNEIRVDFVCLNERSVDTYRDFKRTRDYCGKDNATLVMSSTCPHQLVDLFDQTIVFFRPALSPLSLFARNEREILHYEGPEAVNTSLSFAAHLNPKAIILAGVDLGSSNPSQLRSKYASGSTERTMELVIPGNKKRLVQSTKSLIDTKYILELTIASNPSIEFYNYSDGALIKGAKVLSDELVYSEQFQAARHSISTKQREEIVSNLLASMPLYDKYTLEHMWNACDARNSVRGLALSLKNLIQKHRSLDIDFCIQLQKCLDLSAPKHQQIGRRIFRSAIIRACLLVLQQRRIIQYSSSHKMDKYVLAAKQSLIRLVYKLENDCYMLFDTIDNHLFN